MTLSTQQVERGIARSNKVYVHTTHSSDGRSREGFWLSYAPDDGYALFLMLFALENSDGVEYYSVFDAYGERAKPVNASRNPKQV